MPTNHEGHDMGKPEGVQAHPAPKIDDNHPGYEIQDVNVAGISTFLAGLFGFVLIFFVFCFFMGKAINNILLKQDGPVNKWQANLPRLESDDGNQDIADLHAREDLLLNYYSTSNDLPAGTVRIPIDRAMQLIVQRGLGTPAATQQPEKLMAGEAAPVVNAPLTDGFARTGYELDTIEARNERNNYEHAEK